MQSASPGRDRNAERAFREAFERLKSGSMRTLPAGSPVTQNNVAREAGTDPSALKKARFPELVQEIQAWVAANYPAQTASASMAAMARRETRTVRQQLADLRVQHDLLASLLVEADARIVELTQENDRLRALMPPSNVTRIGG